MKFYKVCGIILLISFLLLIYAAWPSPRRMIKENIGIEVSEAKFKADIHLMHVSTIYMKQLQKMMKKLKNNFQKLLLKI